MDPDHPPLRCAPAAEHRHDPLFATAPPAKRWLLVEHRGAWPRQALTALRPTATTGPDPGSDLSSGPDSSLGLAPDSGSDPSGGDWLAAEVSRLCVAAGIRAVLIRRHGRPDRTSPRRWALVDSRPGQESIRWGDLPTDEHVLKVLDGTDPGTPSTDPIYLICAHGRHDACCAMRGRPAAAALSAAFPERTWECSHIGGDRFAANLVMLPHSLFYGHVPTTEAVALATSYNEGLVVPQYLRGSGAHPAPVQAAQHFARESGASLAINALQPTTVTKQTPNTWQVHLTPDYEITLTTTTTKLNAAMTCSALPPSHLTTYTLKSVE